MNLPIAPYVPILLAAARSMDKRYRVTSLYRSVASQTRLYKAWLARGRRGIPAAPPGRSFHELGEAVDIARTNVDPFRDSGLAALGAWWTANGLGWSPHDPVHFQLRPIGAAAAGASTGERLALRTAGAPDGPSDMPIHHPAFTRGLQAPVYQHGDDPPPSLAQNLEVFATQTAARALHEVPVIGQALDLVSVPFKLAGAPDLATSAATAAIGGITAIVGGLAEVFGGGPPMYYTPEGGRELSRRIKASMDLDDAGRATAPKWGA